MVMSLMPYQLTSYGLSDTGRVRKNNEDVWGSLPQYHLYVVADGMGGHQAGEVAAREATLFLLTHLRQLFEKEKVSELSVEEVRELIRLGIIETNHFVFGLSQTHELLRGMGTTLLCLYFHKDSVVVAHVGDSRIYRSRNKLLEQLTKDHSLLRELMDMGKTCRHTDTVQVKNIITRAIGTEPFVQPSVEVSKLSPGDLYLLCSDGLTDLVTFEEIQNLLACSLTLEEKVRSLVSIAMRKGGHDNVTAVCVEVKENSAQEGLSRQ